MQKSHQRGLIRALSSAYHNPLQREKKILEGWKTERNKGQKIRLHTLAKIHFYY